MDHTVLELEGSAFTDADLAAIANLDKVESLGLWDTEITDTGCRSLVGARSLAEISIISDHLSDQVLQVLAQLPALRSLQIHHGPKIGDHGLRFLAGCVGLRELYLKQTAITDKGLKAICRLPAVWSLILDDTGVSDDGCSALAEMPRLSLLSLNRTEVTGGGLASLRDNEHFHLYLNGTPATDEGVIALTRRRSNLILISLNETGVGDRAARALSKLSRINDVRLSHTNLTDKGLLAFSGHPFLDVIYVEGCEVTEAGINSLKEASPRDLTVYGADDPSTERTILSISPVHLPEELHYIIPLAEQHGSEARVSNFDRSLGRHVDYGETLDSDEIGALRRLYLEIKAKNHGPLINTWHQEQQSNSTCPAETTWPI